MNAMTWERKREIQLAAFLRFSDAWEKRTDDHDPKMQTAYDEYRCVVDTTEKQYSECDCHEAR